MTWPFATASTGWKATTTNGEKVELRFRATLGFRKIAGSYVLLRFLRQEVVLPRHPSC